MKPRVWIEPLEPLKIAYKQYPAGTKRWKVHYRERSRRNLKNRSLRKSETFYSLRDAENFKICLESEPTRNANDITMRELVEEFESRKLAHMHDTTQRDYRFVIDYYILPEFRNTLLDAIKPAEIERLMESCISTPVEGKHKPAGVTTANKIRRVLIFLFRFASKLDYTSKNPAVAADRYRVKKRRMNPLTVSEIGQIVYAADEPIRTIVLLAASTGLRQGEILGLKWRDVSMDKRCLNLRQQFTENREGALKTASSRRVVPLLDPVAVALRLHKRRMEELGRPAGAADWVFPGYQPGLDAAWEPYRQWTILNRFRKALKNAGIDPEAYRFHDLRASFAVNAIGAGRPVNEVQAILGHESPHMTLHYAKLARGEQANQSLHKIEDQLIPRTGTQVVPNSKIASK